jgi:1-acyl-sn-glycerol-3-phosphate acyltransferase
MSADELPSPLHRNIHYRSFQWFMQVVSTVWFRYQAAGMEQLPQQGGALLLINHQSHLDPLMAGLPLQRPVSFLARDSLFRVPLVGWMLRNTYVVPINREAASTSSLREAIRRVQHGFLVGIFPEGTRSVDGEIGTLKPGFLALMRRANVPVYPVGIAGTLQAFPRGAWFVRPAAVRVVFGKAFDPDLLHQFGRDREAELLTHVRQRIVECQQQADDWRQQGRRPCSTPNSTPFSSPSESSMSSRTSDSP